MSDIKLFFDMFLINLFTFGGGYTIIPIIEEKFVKNKLIDENEMKKIISIATSTPGVMAISTSFLVGYKIKKIKGAFICVLASIIPCIVIISLIYKIYDLFIVNTYIKAIMNGIAISVSAILLSNVFKMFLKIFNKKKKYLYLFIFILSFILSYIFKINIAIILLIASILGSDII